MFNVDKSSTWLRLSFWRSTLAPAVVIVAVLFAAGASGAWAARLEGFGPIRFGMTLDEALRAVGEEGLKLQDETGLLYDVPTGIKGVQLEIHQRFVDGRADKGLATTEAAGTGRCLALEGTLARQLEVWYGVEPMVRPGTVSNLFGGVPSLSKEAAGFSDIFFFSFEDGAYMEMQFRAYDLMSRGACWAHIWFRPPITNEPPF